MSKKGGKERQKASKEPNQNIGQAASSDGKVLLAAEAGGQGEANYFGLSQKRVNVSTARKKHNGPESTPK